MNFKRLSPCLIVFLFSLLFILPPSLYSPKAKANIEGSFTLQAVNDTWTNSASPDAQAWYTWPNASIGNYNTTYGLHYGWFKFNLTEGYRGEINLTKATLFLYAQSVDTSDTYGYYHVKSIDPTNETWNEDTITWNNQPTLYDWYESSDNVYVDSPSKWYEWRMFTGNATQGLGALQVAYDNNSTKSYCVYLNISYDYYSSFRTYNYGSNVPKLIIEYEIEVTTETQGAPDIEEPNIYTLTFYALNDSRVYNGAPDTNFGNETTTQVSYIWEQGVINDYLIKFDITTPDYVDDTLNEGNYDLDLSTTPFDAYEITLYVMCSYVSESEEWYAFDYIKGIARNGESWLEMAVTWNNKPEYRYFNTSSVYVDQQGEYTFDVSNDEGFLRASATNDTTYTLTLSVDSSRTQQGYNNWYCREYESDITGLNFSPYLVMRVAMEDISLALPSYLTFTTAHIYLGAQWTLTPFIAGHLLSAIIYTIIIIPVVFISRKILVALLTTIVLMTLFLMFTWLHIGVYAIVLLVSALTQGAKLKKWIG